MSRNVTVHASESARHIPCAGRRSEERHGGRHTEYACFYGAWRAAVGLVVLLTAATAALAAPPECSQPIGIFDSGTGGLAVFEQIIKLDLFDNRTRGPAEKGDGRPDFQKERFVFLADQANMPYGNYPVIGKERFLVELVEEDARFLLGSQYFASPTAARPSTDKRPAKAIVIACNTATAFGKTAVEKLLAKTAPQVEVIGVIDAAAQGAVEALQQGPPGTIGVLATEGTVASGAYPKAIQAFAKRSLQNSPRPLAGEGPAVRAASAQAAPEQKRLREEITVVQQGGYGLAGAVDGAPEFIARSAASDRPRPGYRGPSLTNPLAPIEPRLLPRYSFDFSARGMLWEGDRGRPSALQINSVENYIAYHVVSLLEKIRTAPQAKPLRVVVLGCTHYPFYVDAIRAQLARLYDYRENGQYVYRSCLAADVKLIDPAIYVGRELYQRLARKQLLAESPALAAGETRCEFYITVPWRQHPGVRLEANGWLTYDYKYGRSPGQPRTDTRAVPWDESYLGPEVAQRLARQVPTVWEAVRQFKADSAKTRAAEEGRMSKGN